MPSSCQLWCQLSIGPASSPPSPSPAQTTSKVTFHHNIANTKELLGSSADYFSVCLPSGSGDIISQLGGDTTALLKALEDTINGMNSFNATSTISSITQTWDPTYAGLNDRYRGKVLDFSSSSDLTLLRNIASRTGYSGCTSGTFSSDSWIPTILSGASVSCSGATGNVDDTQCNTQANIQTSGNGCDGCIDSLKVLNVISGSIAADLKTRYNGGGDCDTFSDDLAEVYTNFYGIKEANYVTSNLITRANTAETDMNAFEAAVTTVGNRFTNVLSSLQTTSSSVTDPQYGMVAGFNCAIFGENANRVVNAFCARTFVAFYYLRLTMGISAFGILFAMCCSVCSGVRHYKHGERKDKLMPETGHDSMGNLNAKY